MKEKKKIMEKEQQIQPCNSNKQYMVHLQLTANNTKQC